METIEKISIENEDKEITSVHKSRKLLVFLGGLGIIILLLAAGTGFAYLSVKSLLVEKDPLERDANSLKLAVKEQNLEKIKASTKDLESDLGRLQQKVGNYRLLGSLPIVKNYYNDANHAITAGMSGLKAGNLVVEAISPYADILGLGGDKNSSGSGKTTLDRVTFMVTTLDKIRPQLDKIGFELETARKEMDQIDPNRYPEELKGFKIRQNLSLGISTLDQASSLITDAKPFIEVLPDLMGVNSPKFYFVLFQNDAELRPTGGFMTAYGILKVDKGKITPVLSEDIYSLDNAFNKKLPAPDPIKKFHKDVPYYYLRDMNLSPDFAVSMQEFMGYYKQLPIAQKVDGVIGVDTKLLVGLLKVLGSIGVPEWGNFSAENDKRCDCPQVVYRLEEIADKPVSTMKTARKAVIGPLMHSILANAFNSPKSKMAELFNVGLTAIQEKHVLFYLFDEKSQKAVEAFNLAGRVRNYDGDYQLLVDTNFAGAKSNLFINQKIEEKFELAADGTVTKTINVTYNNPFKASDCGLLSGGLCLNGQYRDWIRL
ncbi:MAG: DUF4012 domain-containing protein, partial [Patescibacteria group bacterium]|nr:DUF4012 domain-containing protein [Patescibacteria group bacterium]